LENFWKTESAMAVDAKDLAFLLSYWAKWLILEISSLTLLNEPRQMAC
jgi:hypothetical protein